MSGAGFGVVGSAVLSEPPAPADGVQACQSRENDECFQICDEKTGRPLTGLRYRIEGATVSVEGVTDAQGRTERVHTGRRVEMLTVFILHGGQEAEDETDEPPTCP